MKLGGGGGGCGHLDSSTNGSYNGGNGGAGVVIVSDPTGSFSASSCWDLRAVFRQVQAGDWT